MVDIFQFLLLGGFTGLLAGMFGIGGGSVLVPALIFIFYGMGFDDSIVVYLAIGTSLTSIFFSALSSAYSHHLKQSVEWRLVTSLSIGMVAGALIGSRFATSINNDDLKLIITLFLLAVGAEMIFSYMQLLISKTKKVLSISNITAPFHGTWIGFLSSIIGIGGGSFTTPLMIAGGYNIRKGIGTAAACGAPIAIAGALGYMYFGQDNPNLPNATSGFIFWPAVIGISCTSILTAKVGANFSHSVSEKNLKRSFGFFLMIIGILVAAS
jgi:uncharacterized membrane protein YfcA